MANDTTQHARPAPGNSPDPAVSDLMAAVEVFVNTLGDVPFGAAGTILECINEVRELIDKITFAMLAPLAQIEASANCCTRAGRRR